MAKPKIKGPPDRGGRDSASALASGPSNDTSEAEDNGSPAAIKRPAAQRELGVDLAQARQFLGMLDRNAESFTFQTFDDGEEKDVRLAKVFNGTFDEHAAQLQRLNGQGAGIFVTVNETDGHGRKRENVTKVRAFVVDLDGAPLEPVLKAAIKPHIVVETSPQRWHCWWKPRDCPLDQFEATQAALAAKFGADPTVKDLPRCMRVPGFLHSKTGKPFLSRVVPRTEWGTNKVVVPIRPTFADFQAAMLGGDPEAATDASDASDAAAVIPKGERDNALFRIACKLRKDGLSEDEIAAALFRVNENRCRPSLSEAQVREKAHSACRYPAGEQGVGASGDPLKLVSATEFARELPELSYIWDGVLAKGYVYSMTSQPGGGKTAIALPLGMSVAAGGRPFAGHETTPGKVVWIAAENDLDARQRFIGACNKMGLQPEDLARSLMFLPQSFALSERIDELTALMEPFEPTLVIVDTDQATFGGDEKDNSDRIEHAKQFRQLTRIGSRPAVLILSHPTKSAGKNDQYPRGGSAFLAEIDGNLCLWKDEDTKITTLWRSPRKYRGPDFERMEFEFIQVLDEHLKDPKGRLIPTIFARSVDRPGEQIRVHSDRYGGLLRHIDQFPKASTRVRAEALQISQPTVVRMIKDAEGVGLIEPRDPQYPDKLHLTLKGRELLIDAPTPAAEAISRVEGRSNKPKIRTRDDRARNRESALNQ